MYILILIYLLLYFKLTHAIKQYIRIGFDLETGNDIVEAAKGLSGTSLANIEPDCDKNAVEEMEISETKRQKTKKAKIKTIKGISKLYYWEWPVEGEYGEYIRARSLLHIGEWSNL